VLGTTDETNPVIAKAARWSGVRFYRYAVVDPKSSAVIARLADQTPLLMEQKLGAGKVMALATALDNVSSDFPVQPAFVPFVEQLALRLSGWEEAATSTVVDAQFEVGGGGTSRAFEILGPDGRRAVSLEESAKGAPVVADRDGFWEIRRGSGRDQMIAVNLDRRESDLEPISSESAQMWAGGVAETASAGGGSPEQTRRSLAVAAVAFALLSACAEAWVGSKYLTRRPA